jgi:hypothetical protein
MLLITTSNGVFRLEAEDPTPTRVLARRKGFWPLRRGSGGIFGIAPHPEGDSYITASREKLGTPRLDKPWTDVRLYRVWKDPGRAPRAMADLRDIHDVHQIEVLDSLVLLTDTGKNRVGVYDLESGVQTTLDVGGERADINHLNALHVTTRTVMVGLNNRGDRPAGILAVDRDVLRSLKSGSDLLRHGSLRVLGEQRHTHDIEPFGDDFLYCASHDGQVHRMSTGEAVLHCGDWVRGLAVNGDGLWVGVSALAERARRQSEDLDGQVHLYDARSLTLLRSWQLKGAGQVYDLAAW